MRESGEPGTPVRTVLLGMRCAATEPVLDALLREPGIDLQAVVVPAASPTTVDPVVEQARENGVPVHDPVRRTDLDRPEFRDALETIAPDLVVVACFPWRIPAWLRTRPRTGTSCINIHPSLLPDGRGPEPVFWAFRWGLEATGVTLHLVDAGFDTGPIVVQERFVIPDCATIGSVERSLAALGARLLIDILPALRNGTVTASPQGLGRARHAPIPGPDDLLVPTSWAAGHAARFIRAVSPVYGPPPILVQATGQRLASGEVFGADETVTIPEPVLRDGALVRIRFTPGVLTVRLHAYPQPLRLQRPPIEPPPGQR